MDVFENEKRKNDQRRRFQWWLLIIGFVFGVVVTVLLMPRASAPYTVYNDTPPDDIAMTATDIIRQATGTAQAIFAPNEQMFATDTPLPPTPHTATDFVQQATQPPAAP